MTRWVTLACFMLFGCQKGAGSASPTRLRLGFFPTVTHEVALTMLERGELQRSLAPVTVEKRPFNAGPEAMEALFAGGVDASYVGSMPAVNAYLRSNGEALVIVAGAASGGAAFVVSRDSGINGPDDLHGKKLATPQIGNTQDLAMRTYLRDHGLKPRELGGDVQLMPIAPPEIVQLMKTGGLDGAWVVEPTVSRLVHEAGARVLLDERTAYPKGLYPTAVLVVTRKLAAEHPDQVQKLLNAHVATVRFIRAHGEEARELTAKAIFEHAHKKLPDPVMKDAWSRVAPEYELPTEGLKRVLDDGRAVGVLPKGGELASAIDDRFVKAVPAP
jgi:NitT/TauT family transport system substrate-binding protein